jgi:hypothetical protein
MLMPRYVAYRPRVDTWNIARVDIVEWQSGLRRRFVRYALLWALAFVVILVAALAGMEAAEAAPSVKIGAGSSFGVPFLLAALLGGAGALTTLLWRRLLAPDRVVRSRRIK